MAAYWQIVRVDGSEPTALAAAELARILPQMDPQAQVTIEEGAYDPARSGVLWLGVSDDIQTPGVKDRRLDDGFSIRVSGCAGHIAGTNPRSVLIAAYRFLREGGCAFVRPGRAGEYIPQTDSAALSVSVFEAAANRHRGICIEGGVSYEVVAQTIDWAPKAGFNSYFTQFFVPFEFFDRWYSHTGNPWLTPTPVSEETVESFMADYSREIARRGMMNHGVGHGWTAGVLGVPGKGWFVDDQGIPEDRAPYAAMLDGQRGLFHGVALNTNLCYGNPEVRRRMVQDIVAYADAHREVDYLHLWLADGYNNHCECDLCKDEVPADQYIQILNELDAALTARELPTRVVFLIYVDLLWPPVRERFMNPGRFTLMFAPITRTYTEPMSTTATGAMTPYRRNGVALPRSVGDSRAYLTAWQQVFTGDSFVFDYHYMWDHFKDPGYYEMAKVLAQDIENLPALNLGGYMSCQNQRVFLPTGLGMVLMGDALWKGAVDFDGEAAAYFAAAYGNDGEACRRYMQTLSERFDPPALRGEKPAEDPEAARRYDGIPAVLDAFLPVISRNLHHPDPCRAQGWDYLLVHSGLCRRLAAALAARARGDGPAMAAAWEQTRRYACEQEYRMAGVFDVYEFIQTFGGMLGRP